MARLSDPRDNLRSVHSWTIRHLLGLAVLIACSSNGLAQSGKRQVEVLVFGRASVEPDSCEAMVMAKYGFRTTYKGCVVKPGMIARNNRAYRKLERWHGGDWEVLFANDLLGTCGSDRWYHIIHSPMAD